MMVFGLNFTYQTVTSLLPQGVSSESFDCGDVPFPFTSTERVKIIFNFPPYFFCLFKLTFSAQIIASVKQFLEAKNLFKKLRRAS